MKHLLFSTVVLALLAGGCTSKSKANARAREAFIAGQQQAWTQFQMAQPRSVRVLGPVQNPILPWVEGMTISQALLAADYRGPTPRVIVLHRGLQTILVDPAQLLSGSEVPLVAGDTVEIQP